MALAAIDIRNLTKTYPGHPGRGILPLEALKGVSLTIREGEFFGLLGPNGAGKTTLIKTIVGLARRSSGEVYVFGMDVEKEAIKTKALIGYSPQEPNIDRYFTVRRLLEYHGGYYGLSRAERKRRAQKLMTQFGLVSKAYTENWKLSGGMQKRLLIARSLMTSPKILILDEPTAGVDVEQRHELWNYLSGLNKDGTTIILTTHYIDEAETLCERVGIIHYGDIVEIGAPQALIAKHCQRYFIVQGQKQERINGLTVEDIQTHRGSLEQVFLKLTGQSIYSDERRGNVP